MAELKAAVMRLQAENASLQVRVYHYTRISLSGARISLCAYITIRVCHRTRIVIYGLELAWFIYPTHTQRVLNVENIHLPAGARARNLRRGGPFWATKPKKRRGDERGAVVSAAGDVLSLIHI